eukprot:3625780-Alexandrium_andersonii.AAC.1
MAHDDSVPESLLEALRGVGRWASGPGRHTSCLTILGQRLTFSDKRIASAANACNSLQRFAARPPW